MHASTGLGLMHNSRSGRPGTLQFTVIGLGSWHAVHQGRSLRSVRPRQRPTALTEERSPRPQLRSELETHSEVGEVLDLLEVVDGRAVVELVEDDDLQELGDGQGEGTLLHGRLRLRHCAQQARAHSAANELFAPGGPAGLREQALLRRTHLVVRVLLAQQDGDVGADEARPACDHDVLRLVIILVQQLAVGHDSRQTCALRFLSHGACVSSEMK